MDARELTRRFTAGPHPRDLDAFRKRVLAQQGDLPPRGTGFLRTGPAEDARPKGGWYGAPGERGLFRSRSRVEYVKSRGDSIQAIISFDAPGMSREAIASMVRHTLLRAASYDSYTYGHMGPIRILALEDGVANVICRCTGARNFPAEFTSTAEEADEANQMMLRRAYRRPWPRRT